MQDIIIEKSYRFVPPRHGRFWPAVFQLFLRRHLDRSYGIESAECRGADRLKRSLAAGHGILLAPNHCRPCDPMVLGLLAEEAGRPLYIMASWHLFMQGRFRAWLLPRIGAFSVYREGMDREALKAATDILTEARRPLIIFPEGVISRTNERVGDLMEGTAFIARSAARFRGRASPPGRVVVHPVAIFYSFRGDVTASVTPVLEEIERRLSWRPQQELPLLERIYKVGGALLCLKEIEYLGRPQPGGVAERLGALIDHLLTPLEKEWLERRQEGQVVARVKRLRSAILPEMVAEETQEAERSRRWRQLADLYLAQQLSCYPPDYIRTRPTAERLLETVERFEEDLTDRTRIHRPFHVVIEVGEALEVAASRDRSKSSDPLIERMKEELEGMLDRLGNEAIPSAPAPTSPARGDTP